MENYVCCQSFQCINFFKSSPFFSCRFEVKKVPDSGLQFDTIRAVADYEYKVQKRTVVEVHKTKQVNEVSG